MLDKFCWSVSVQNRSFSTCPAGLTASLFAKHASSIVAPYAKNHHAKNH